MSNFETHTSTNEQFTRLLLLNHQRLYRFSLSLIPNFSDANDIFQDAILVMCRKFDELKDHDKFLQWGMGIIHFKTLQMYEKNRKTQTFFSERAFEIIQAKSMESIQKSDDRMEALENCIGKLSPEDQSLIQMRYQKKNTIKQVAEKLNRSVHVLYKVYMRIHSSLRLCIKNSVDQRAI